MLTRTQIENSAIADLQENLCNTLYRLKDSYPGKQTGILGRQLIQLLELRKGVSGIKSGVLYTIYGQMKGEDKISISVTQPGADTEPFEIDLVAIDDEFCELRDKEWNK